MGWAYLVLVAIAALGLALGWRLTPTPETRDDADGLARLLQLGIALTGLTVLVLLLVPWFMGLGEVSCTPEAERAGECIMGLRDNGLFGAAAFACLTGAAFAFVLRKGILDFPAPAPIAEDEREAGVGDLDTIVPRNKIKPERESKPEGEGTKPKPTKHEAASKPEPEAKTEAASEPEPEPEAKTEPASKPEAKTEPEAKPETEPEPEAAASEPEDRPTGHRRLEGPVFRAFVDDQAVELDVAIRTAADRLRSERVAVVFSRGASKDANEASLELAEAFNAYRYVLEGTAAATEGVPTGDKPDPHAADEAAGPDARHAGELALDLAGAFIQTVFLLDTRVAFPEFVLGKLTELQSVCIAHAHDDVSAACQVMLPGTNPGEREGELIDSGGGTNARRPRAWLVARIVEALRELEGNGESETSDAADDDEKTDDEKTDDES
jgi:hypothetical protein